MPAHKKAFEKNAAGTLPDDAFRVLMENYAAEHENLQDRMDLLNGKLADIEQAGNSATQFVALVERYTDI